MSPSSGVPYFSSADNEADHGYLSTFRGVDGTVTGLGSGHFMNFDPSGGTSLLLPVTVNVANTSISFQFDQPFNTQQADKTNAVTSQVNFYVLDSTGTIIASGHQQQRRDPGALAVRQRADHGKLLRRDPDDLGA